MPAVEISPSLVDAAVDGDQRALEQLLQAVAGDVLRLARRMLWHPEDAEDATQEILIKVATRLSTFRGDARMTTWVHRIAVNHLLTTRRRRAEDAALTFTAFGQDLAHDLDARVRRAWIDEDLLADEVMVGCTQAMLLCLDREHRLAYVLGDVLDVGSEEAASLCASRLRRSASASSAHASGSGLHARTLWPPNPANPCRCHRRVGAAISHERLDPDNLLFARRSNAQARYAALHRRRRDLPQPPRIADPPHRRRRCCAPSPDDRRVRRRVLEDLFQKLEVLAVGPAHRRAPSAARRPSRSPPARRGCAASSASPPSPASSKA